MFFFVLFYKINFVSKKIKFNCPKHSITTLLPMVVTLLFLFHRFFLLECIFLRLRLLLLSQYNFIFLFPFFFFFVFKIKQTFYLENIVAFAQKIFFSLFLVLVCLQLRLWVNLSSTQQFACW